MTSFGQFAYPIGVVNLLMIFAKLKFLIKSMDLSCSNSFSALHYAGTTATVAGWGSMNEEKEELSCQLRDVKVPILTNLECVQLTSYTSGMVTENMMCAGLLGGGKDSCQVSF